MDNQVKTSWWQAHRPTTRRLAQLYSALLYNAHLKGFIEGEIYQGKTKYLCVPGFNCYSCPGAVGACPLGSIQNALDSAGHRAGWYVLGMILLFGVVLGRTICGWLCPLGLIQELLHKIPSPKIRKSCVTRALSWLKYVILAVFAVAIPLWYGLKFGIPVPGFCKYICPAGTFEGAIGLLSNPVNAPKLGMLGILFTRKFIIMLIIGASCVFLYRSFCRFLCPLGAIYGLFNRFNVIGVKVDQSRCTHCGACVRNCGMDVRKVGDHECINCGKCMEFCSQDAISIKAGSITLKAPKGGCAQDGPDAPEKRRRTGRIIWSAAILLLCAALIWYNLPDRTEETKTQEASPSALSGAAANADDSKEAAAEKTDETGAAGAAVAESEDSTSVKDAETEAKKAAASAAETEAEKAAASAAQTEAEKAAASAAETEAEKAAASAAETEAEKTARQPRRQKRRRPPEQSRRQKPPRSRIIPVTRRLALKSGSSWRTSRLNALTVPHSIWLIHGGRLHSSICGRSTARHVWQSCHTSMNCIKNTKGMFPFCASIIPLLQRIRKNSSPTSIMP